MPGLDGYAGDDEPVLFHSPSQSLLPSGTANQTLRNTGGAWAASSALQNDDTNIVDTGNFTAKGATHLFGTAGTNEKLTVGQGTTSTDTAEIAVRSGNSTTAAIPRITLQRNVTKISDWYTDGANTFFEYGGTSGRLFYDAGGVGGGIPAVTMDENGNVAISNANAPYTDAFSVGGSSGVGNFDVTVNGIVSRYNLGTATVKAGICHEVANLDETAQTANLGSTLLFATGTAPGAGMYRVCATIILTTVATSSTIPTAQVSWTDADSSGTPTMNVTVADTLGATGNTTSTGASGCTVMNAKASTNINALTTGYVSAAAATMKWAGHWRLEFCG
jgi:hypothetical protein